jgi:hypothetical protein
MPNLLKFISTLGGVFIALILFLVLPLETIKDNPVFIPLIIVYTLLVVFFVLFLISKVEKSYENKIQDIRRTSEIMGVKDFLNYIYLDEDIKHEILLKDVKTNKHGITATQTVYSKLLEKHREFTDKK